MDKQNIHIIGSGWASIGFLKHIDTNKYNVTVISDNLKFCYTPLLAYNCTNNINLEQDITSINPNIKTIKTKIIDIDINNNKIIDIDNSKINYDYLIFAHGSDVNTFNIKGIKENTFFLKTYDDSIKIKNKISSLKENSTIAIIGCGPTGSELIGNLLDNNNHNILAIDGLKKPLTMYPEKISDYTLDIWNNFNITTFFNNFVNKVDKNNIYFKDTNISYDMAIWCGGIKSNKLTNNINKNLNNNCKFGIPISNTLNVISPKLNFSNIFAIGDCSYSKLPPTAQVAYQQGQYLANNFNKDFKNINNFKYQDKGKICYIGNSKSVFHINYFHYGGNLTYYLNKFIHIYNAVNLNQKSSFMHNFIF